MPFFASQSERALVLRIRAAKRKIRLARQAANLPELDIETLQRDALRRAGIDPDTLRPIMPRRLRPHPFAKPLSID